jgi:hypothetical protein
MPIEITGAHPPEHRLKAGDVVMVKRKIEKQGEDTHDWRFFALVVMSLRREVRAIILDGRSGEQVRTTNVVYDFLDPENLQLWYLPESEWPDGVHVFRTKLILEGGTDALDELL